MKKIIITDTQLKQIVESGDNTKPKKTVKIIPNVSVTHMEGTGEKYPPEEYGYQSWKEFWEEKNGRRFPSTEHKCPSCPKDASSTTEFVGAHVIDSKGNMYVTPTCKDCNTRAINDDSFRRKPFTVKKRDLVPFCPDELKKERQKR